MLTHTRRRNMIFGKHVNRYYLKFAPRLLLGLATLVVIDYLLLVLPNLYQMVVNGMNDGFVIKDGVKMIFDMDFFVDHISLPLLVIILSMVFCRFLWRICFFSAGIGVETDLRNRMFSHCKDLSREYYQVNKVVNLIILFTNDLDTIK